MALTITDKLILSSLLPTEASRYRLHRLLREQRDKIDWDQLAQRGEYLMIFPLLRHNLGHLDALPLLPDSFREILRQSSETWAARELGVISQARRLIALLQAHGIQAIPLKGAAIMLGGFYPKPGLRPALDIDLLVPPDQLATADLLLEQHGYQPLPGRRALRPRQRLANEQNHLWPRRSPAGQVIELHHRAFRYSAGERDFGYDEIWRTARSIEAGFLPLPTPGDLAFHLIHHTMVDLQSGHAILRTLTDLHFIFGHDPEAFDVACRRAAGFGFPGAVYLAEQAVNHLASANLEALEVDAARPELALLLETALLSSHSQLAEAARLFEYFNFSRRPLDKAGNLLAILFPTRPHLEQVERGPATESILLKYLRRPISLFRKVDWSSLEPANLARLRRLRRICHLEKKSPPTDGERRD